MAHLCSRGNERILSAATTAFASEGDMNRNVIKGALEIVHPINMTPLTVLDLFAGCGGYGQRNGTRWPTIDLQGLAGITGRIAYSRTRLATWAFCRPAGYIIGV